MVVLFFAAPRCRSRTSSGSRRPSGLSGESARIWIILSASSAFSDDFIPILVILFSALVRRSKALASLLANLASLLASITSHLALRLLAFRFWIDSTMGGKATAMAEATAVTAKSAPATTMAVVLGTPARLISRLPPERGTPTPAIFLQVGSRGLRIACYPFRPERLFW